MTADSQPTSTSADDPWTIGRLLTWTTDYLTKCGADSPRLDAEVLLAHARGCERIMLYTAFDEPASESLRATFREMVRRRAEGSPVAHLVGHKEFYSLKFAVTPDVLVPRPETEYLVMTGLDFAKTLSDPPRILEVGTGSGAVAVTLARELPEAEIIATDISAAALAVARQNAENHGVDDRVTLLQGDLLDALAAVDGPAPARFNLILSNPPYVGDAEMKELPQDVAAHEPKAALRGGGEGAELTQRLILQAVPRLEAGGLLAFETSPMLADRLQAFVGQQQDMEPAEVKPDLAGRARVVAAKKR